MNIAGLAIGLVIFVFGGLLVSYEREHDSFFANVDRTYTIGATAAPGLNVGIDKLNTIYSAVGPIIEAELTDVDLVARTIIREFLVTRDENGFYESIRFADPEFLHIFDLEYLHGDASALDDASGVLLTQSMANKFYGRTNVVGEIITLDNEFDFRVTAVVRDVPANSHFNSLPVMEADFGIVMPIRALTRLRDFDEAGNFNNLSMGNFTYVMLPEHLDRAWLQTQMDGLYERNLPESNKEDLANFWVVPLGHANLSIWDAFGMPVVSVVQLLSFLVLLVACVNYTNLATAQSLGRSREVGMRKTMGAGKGQLLAQFLVESLVIAAIAMVLAIAILEVIIPLFNNAAGKVLALDYLATLPFLALTVFLVGIGAGLYPAWLITRATPIEALRDTARKGKKGTRMRAIMIGVQFAISAFMLSLVSIVYMQNQKVEQDSYVFPRSEIYVLQRLGVDEIQDRLDTLRLELEALTNVEHVSYSSQVPYEQNNSGGNVTARAGDEAGKFVMQFLRMSPEFLEAYDIPILAGRNFSETMSTDLLTDETEVAHVLVNEMALEKLGIDNPADAVNTRFYNMEEGGAVGTVQEYVIIGVVPTQNITGLFNSLKPWMYIYDDRVRIASVRISGGNMMETINQVEAVWKGVMPDYPIQGRFLDEVFDDVYSVLQIMNLSLAGFAFVALALALFGLFGLAAFMAAQRTKEIGVRKVLGANSIQIARLLVWQFSRPVLWALLVALPIAFMASQLYLNFFAERIETTVPILLLSGMVAIVFAWGTVAAHAVRIARSNPVMALRYE
jgi:putative ABC transport system permease protein